MPDSEEKRRELAQYYASISEEELRELAEEAWSLTEIGKETLRHELARRGLKIELAAAPPPDVKLGNLVTIREFRDLPEALLAEGFLKSVNIECFLVDENTIRMDWLWSNALGGIKLLVKSEDADAARQMLSQGITDGFHVDEVGEHIQPRCPQCQSLDISFEDLNKRITYGSMLVLGFPIVVHRRRWKCQSCGHIWLQADEDPKQNQ
jgi:hypothetical protein